jgi:ubiquinone/menaquinone biosynthesis C-methylase UbiE
MGARYAALHAIHARARRVTARLEDALFAIEGRRGVLGPAHRGFARHEATGDSGVWAKWDWSRGGEEWTESPEWKESLVEHVLRGNIPPGGTILEIGPGANRWTDALHELAEHLVLVESTDEVLDLSRSRFGEAGEVTYVRTTGADLPGVADDSVDSVWSFDVFVHLAPLDVASYLGEINRVLRPGGVAVVHHSGRRERRGWRAPMSARLFATLAREHGLEVERQFDTWEDGRFDVRIFGDVITAMRAPAASVAG